MIIDFGELCIQVLFFIYLQGGSQCGQVIFGDVNYIVLLEISQLVVLGLLDVCSSADSHVIEGSVK